MYRIWIRFRFLMYWHWQIFNICSKKKNYTSLKIIKYFLKMYTSFKVIFLHKKKILKKTRRQQINDFSSKFIIDAIHFTVVHEILIEVGSAFWYPMKRLPCTNILFDVCSGDLKKKKKSWSRGTPRTMTTTLMRPDREKNQLWNRATIYNNIIYIQYNLYSHRFRAANSSKQTEFTRVFFAQCNTIGK